MAFPFSFVKDDAPGTPQAAPNAFRAFFIRVFDRTVSFGGQLAVAPGEA